MVTSKTEITAKPVSGGEGWTSTVAIEPTGLRLTVVGSLLVVDAADSATDGGKSVQAVLDRATGLVRWKRVFKSLLPIAYVDTDAIVAYRAGTWNYTIERIDLLTGNARWNRAPGDAEPTFTGSRRRRVTVPVQADRALRSTVTVCHWPSGRMPNSIHWPPIPAGDTVEVSHMSWATVLTALIR